MQQNATTLLNSGWTVRGKQRSLYFSMTFCPAYLSLSQFVPTSLCSYDLSVRWLLSPPTSGLSVSDSTPSPETGNPCLWASIGPWLPKSSAAVPTQCVHSQSPKIFHKKPMWNSHTSLKLLPECKDPPLPLFSHSPQLLSSVQQSDHSLPSDSQGLQLPDEVFPPISLTFVAFNSSSNLGYTHRLSPRANTL